MERANDLGLDVSWKRKEKHGTARTVEEFARQQPERLKKIEVDDRLKDVFNDPVEEDIWSEINALNYHARGW